MNQENNVIYLFPDTNLFVQCRRLDELEWILWKEYNEVRLVVTRPVQREIDNQKSKGKGRVNKRARSAASLFKATITSEDGFTLVREQDPRVTLMVKPEFLPDLSLADRLDYSEVDDQLVGTVSTFIKANSSSVATLLTHDSGPMASAKMVGVPFSPIPDDWLLQPESTGNEKMIRNLEGQIARLKAIEPRITVLCPGADGKAADQLEFCIKQYQPLSDDEIAALINDVRVAFPVETDFGSLEPAEREYPRTGAFRLPGLKQVYEPAAQDDITTYCEKFYPLWLEKCEERLRTLHEALQTFEDAPTFFFVARNEGTRPARDVLVSIEALGRFQILPPGRELDHEGDEDDADAASVVSPASITALPSPPKPPKGRWLDSINETTVQFSKLWRSLAPSIAGIDLLRLESHRPFRPPLAGLHPANPDPNVFYYKPSRPTRAAASFSLECAQWRHGVDAEVFSGQIHVPQDGGRISGALRCRIHAENLSETVCLHVPVRISVQSVRVLDVAKQLINRLQMAEPNHSKG